MQNSSSVCVFCFKPQWYRYIPSTVAISSCKIKAEALTVAGGFWAVILSQAAWKRSWVGCDQTHSIIVVDRSIAITGNMAWTQLLTA